MSEHDRDEALIRAMRESFEGGLESVTEFDRTRLRRARKQALAQVNGGVSGGVSGEAGSVRRSVTRHSVWLAPAALAASAALVALLIFPSGPMPWSTDPAVGEDARLAEQATVSDLEILLAEDDLSLYADLDFYVWLEAQLAEQGEQEMSDAG